MNINDKIREYLYSDKNVISKGEFITELTLTPNKKLSMLVEKYGEFYVGEFHKQLKKHVEKWFKNEYTENGEINMSYYNHFTRMMTEEFNFRNLMALDRQINKIDGIDISKCTKQELELIQGLHNFKTMTVYDGKEPHNFGWNRTEINEKMSSLLGCCTLQYSIKVQSVLSASKEDKDEGK